MALIIKNFYQQVLFPRRRKEQRRMNIKESFFGKAFFSKERFVSEDSGCGT